MLSLALVGGFSEMSPLIYQSDHCLYKTFTNFCLLQWTFHVCYGVDVQPSFVLFTYLFLKPGFHYPSWRAVLTARQLG